MTESESPGVADEAGAEEPDQDSTGSENIEPANVAPATAESPPDGAADDEPDAEAVAAPARAPRSNRAAFALIAVAVVALIGVNVVRWATGDSGAATDTSPTSAPVATGALRPSFELTRRQREPVRLRQPDAGPADLPVLRIHQLPRHLPHPDGHPHRCTL